MDVPGVAIVRLRRQLVARQAKRGGMEDVEWLPKLGGVECCLRRSRTSGDWEQGRAAGHWPHSRGWLQEVALSSNAH